MSVLLTLIKRLTAQRINLTFCALATLVALLAAFPALASSPVQDPAIARCEPAVASEWSGTSIQVELYIQDVADLYGADVRLSFDASGLQVEDANNYPDDGVQIEPISDFLSADFIIKKDADNDEGTIWYAVTETNPTEPATGSGSIARATFDALRAGTYTLPFTYHKLTTRTGEEIPSAVQDCQITFWGPIELEISRTVNGNELSWSYLGADIHHFEVWRSNTQPYLLPDDGEAISLQPGPPPGDTIYEDTDAGAEQNQYYLVRGVKADDVTKSAPSNRVGAFHFALVPGNL
jgi:hypothetical protein